MERDWVGIVELHGSNDCECDSATDGAERLKELFNCGVSGCKMGVSWMSKTALWKGVWVSNGCNYSCCWLGKERKSLLAESMVAEVLKCRRYRNT